MGERSHVRVTCNSGFGCAFFLEPLLDLDNDEREMRGRDIPLGVPISTHEEFLKKCVFHGVEFVFMLTCVNVVQSLVLDPLILSQLNVYA